MDLSATDDVDGHPSRIHSAVAKLDRDVDAIQDRLERALNDGFDGHGGFFFMTGSLGLGLCPKLCS